LVPSKNRISCNRRCSVTKIAEAYGYPLPPKSDKEEKESTKVKRQRTPEEINRIVDEMNAKLRAEEKAKVEKEFQEVSSKSSETPKAGATGNSTPGIKAERLSDIEIKPVNWVVKKLIPRGMLTLATGIEAVGKTTVLCDIAASVTKAGGNVLWLAAEDSPE